MLYQVPKHIRTLTQKPVSLPAKTQHIKEFNDAVTNQNLNKKVAAVGENDRTLSGLENARPLVRAAYDTNEGKIIQDQQGSTIFELGDNFVIAAVASVTEEGIADFEDVKARVELAVTKDKKAELLKQKAQNALQQNANLQAVSNALNAPVKNASSVNFNSIQIPGVGMEPAVIGTVASLEPDKISEPVAGNNGVFVVKVTSINELNNANVTNEKSRLAQNLNFRANSQAFEAHRNAVEIVDKRSKFY